MRRLHLIHLHDEADELLTKIAQAQRMARSEVVESALTMYVLTAGDPDGHLSDLCPLAENVYSVSHGFYDGPAYGKNRAQTEDLLLQLASGQARVLLSDDTIAEYVFGQFAIDYDRIREGIAD